MPSFCCWPPISPSRLKIANMRLAWLEESSRLSPDDRALAERIVRLQVSMGHAERKLARAAQLRPVPGVGQRSSSVDCPYL